MTHLSLVIPTYNEANAIQGGKLSRVATWLSEQSFDAELIVVDDDSQDDTVELARPIADQVISVPHAGKAWAILAGIQKARGEIVLFSDMDQATPISEASRLLEAIGQSADVAIGSRGMVRKGAPLGRNILSWSQVALRNTLLGLKITDTQCGFKAMTQIAALDIVDHLLMYHPSRMKPIQGPSVTSGFDVEFLFVAQRLGYTIREVPVTWNYQETRRVNLVKDAWRGVRDLIKIFVSDLRGQYPKLKSAKIKKARTKHPPSS